MVKKYTLKFVKNFQLEYIYIKKQIC